jgi:hypothetical protein
MKNMVRMKQIYKVVMLLSLLAFKPAYADDATQNIHFVGRYGFAWEGIALAAAELSIDQDKDSYSLRIAIETRGLVNMFTHHVSDTSAHGRRDGDKYLPETYESHYWTKKKPRHIKLAFNDKGVVTEETVEPPEDRTERPEVPHNIKDGTLDPLTLLLAVRAGNLSPRVFDAKHVYDGKAVLMSTKKPLSIAGREVIGYTLTRTPVAGMTAKEMKEYAKGEPPLTFYFTGDATRVPFYISMPVYLGSLTGKLLKECTTWDECAIN